jgi:hypothetical protein
MQAWETTGEGREGAGSEPSATGGVLLLSDVYLLTAASEGREAVAGLSLQIDDSGLTVRKPDGSMGARMTWPTISRLDANGRMRTPGGSPGVVVQADSGDRTHRFLVPARDPAELERQILTRAAWSVTPNLRDTRRPRRGAGLFGLGRGRSRRKSRSS